MFNGKTVIVLGAGASKEVGLPVGYELKNEIRSLLDMKFDHERQLNGDTAIWAAILQQMRDDDAYNDKESVKYSNACRIISNGLPQSESIDYFIHSHREDEKIEFCGKLSIVRSILQAERNSNLYIDTRNLETTFNIHKVGDTWFNLFFKLLTSRYTVDEIPKRLSNITFIVFNYDRCIEHFLYYSLQRVYSIDGNMSAEVLQNLTIYHPYGTVGDLPWQSSSDYVEYGDNPNSEQLLKSLSLIKTFTESTKEAGLVPPETVAMRKCIAEADTVLFLGFSFQELNLQLLHHQGATDRIRSSQCYYSAYGLTNSDHAAVAKLLRKYLKFKQDKLNWELSLKCNAFFVEFGKTLSLQ